MMLIPVGELDRSTYLGGSDVANVLGFGFETPLHTYLEKIGEGEPLTEKKQKFYDRRKRNEPRILEELVIDRGIDVVSTGQRYRHPIYDFMAAEIDFEWLVTERALESCPEVPRSLLGTVQNGEIKSVHPWVHDQFGQDGTDQIPIKYCAQSVHGLAVTGRQVCLYGVMVGIDELRTYCLERDNKIIADVEMRLISFWQDNVLSRVAPNPINNDDINTLLAKKNGRPVELDDVTFDLLDRLRYLCSLKNSCEKEEEELKFAIGFYIAKAWGSDWLSKEDDCDDTAILNHRGTECGTWKKQSRTSIDSEGLKKSHPDIAKQFSKTSYFRVFR